MQGFDADRSIVRCDLKHEAVIRIASGAPASEIPVSRAKIVVV